MKMALKDVPDTPFRVPPGIKLISVDVHSGQRSTGAGSIMEAFKPGTAPPDSYGGGGAPDVGAQVTPDVERVGGGTGGLY
jgi:penicillin-binding protein 1A